jgi:hypothetical protein
MRPRQEDKERLIVVVVVVYAAGGAEGGSAATSVYLARRLARRALREKAPRSDKGGAPTLHCTMHLVCVPALAVTGIRVISSRLAADLDRVRARGTEAATTGLRGPDTQK